MTPAATPQSNPHPTIAKAAFVRFAEVAEQINATTKRLEKAALLGEYFNSLEDDDLAHAARYFAGYLFPLRDQRVLSIGGSTLLAALAVVSGFETDALKMQLVTKGDLGDVAGSVLSQPEQPIEQAVEPIEQFVEQSIEQAVEQFVEQAVEQVNPQLCSLTLNDVATAIEQLAQTQGSKRKQEKVVKLLQQATPLEAKYLIKLLVGDLRIGLREGAVEDAIARLAQQKVERIQWVNMLLGDIGKTAVLARHKQLDQAQMQLFHPIKFMLASPVEDLTEIAKQMAGEFAVEDKYDGIRAQVHVAPMGKANDQLLHGAEFAGMRVALFSRTLDEITHSFPDLIAPFASLSRSAFGMGAAAGLILDGEIVPFRDQHVLPFQELQKRLGRKTLSEQLLSEVPVAFIAYDVLYKDGAVLVHQPYVERQAILAALPLETDRIHRTRSQRFSDIALLDAEFTAARSRGNEGLMVKALQASYKPGRRGKDWLKIKRAIATLDVVVTAAEVGTGKRSRFLSDYTFAVRASETDPSLLNVGKAFSGLTDAEVTELSNWFQEHTLQEFAHGKVRLVEPQIVLEVTFDRVQVSNRHKSGYALRFPRILRIRDDKPASEIDTLETVRRLAEMQEG